MVATIDWLKIINYELLRGNSVWRFAAVLVVVLLTMAAARIVQFIIHNYSVRLKNRAGTNAAVLISEAMSKPAYMVIIALGVKLCKLPLFFDDQTGLKNSISVGWDKVTYIIISISFAYALYQFVDVIEYYLNKLVSKTETKLDDMLVPVVRKSLRVTIAIIAALMIAESILGAERITSLLLGAGVGGIAIALAAKDTVANFFGSITIFTDRPFQIDEMIKIGEHVGPVEEVGFRSTRIRTLQGHLVTVPNSVIADSIVENIGRRPFIRRTANITITYDSGIDKTRKAVKIIKEILADVSEINGNPA
ncbi:MAG: mechanosensitive ion channel, partial [Planctomycetes bacterium]|nr:mechanosensitive ion channel [Planctomycetota bacterium]